MGKLANRVYGDALFEYAEENDCIEEWMKEIRLVKKVLENHPEFRQMMAQPKINKTQKIKMLESVFHRNLPEEFLGFLVLVVKKNHFHQLNNMFDHYENRYRSYYKMGRATVSTPMELSHAQKKRVEHRLLETTSYETMKVEYQVDATLLGGMVIEMNHRVLDGSVKKRLHTITTMLKKVPLNEE